MQLLKRHVSSAVLALKYACLEGTVTADARGRKHMMEGAGAAISTGTGCPETTHTRRIPRGLFPYELADDSKFPKGMFSWNKLWWQGKLGNVV